MDAWLIWLIIAVVLAAGEIFSLTAALGMLAGAALITSGLAAVKVPLPFQLLAFTIVSTAGLLLIRPAIARYMRPPQSEKFGVDALVGKQAHVIREVTSQGGRVRIDGEEWTARPYDESLVIPAGAIVDVIQISGSTALVYPREGSWTSQPH